MTFNEEELLAIRKDPVRWFGGFAHFRDEQTRAPVKGEPNVLQRRMFEHYRRCQMEDKPCRMAVLKYRRAGASTGSAALMYMHAQNYTARLGVIGTDYKASANMLEMMEYFGEHDLIPRWTDFSVCDERDGNGVLRDPAAVEIVPWRERVNKIVAGKIVWAHGSTAELYTASNPESARSAGLSGFHATEAGRWPSGGQLDAIETLASMRNTLPKKGFHLAIEESTANGAQGAFYDTCRAARWPEYADWPELHKSCWPLADSEYGRDLQYVFIFAAWYEDERHVLRTTAEEILREERGGGRDDCTMTHEEASEIAARRNEALARQVESTLDAEPWYFGERELIARYGQQGPRGLRLGAEVQATLWEQLAWRRAIIKNVCTRRGLDEFAQEYPSNPLEAFRSSGAPVFDQAGLMALDEALRAAERPECGVIELNIAGAELRLTTEAESAVQIWERPMPGRKYLISIDPTKSAEIVKGTGERDRNSVLVIRDGFLDDSGRWRMARLAARIRPPNQWEDAPLARAAAALSAYYGNAILVVETNLGSGLITRLRDEYHRNLYTRENWDAVKHEFSRSYGWTTDVDTRRQAVSTLQEFIRERRLEIACPNAIAELKTFVFDTRGRARAASGAHDDDVLALAIGLACLPHATTFPVREAARMATEPVDERMWKGEEEGD